MKNKLHGLYAITNEQLMPEKDFFRKARAALAAGVSVLQYRDKSGDIKKRLLQASTLKNLCKEHDAILIINDDIKLTNEVDADGIHIGKDDLSISEVRAQLGDNKIIGVSCYDQLALAQTAAEQNADYIAFGSFFSSSIKPDAPKANIDLISSFKSTHNNPVCCIGGITTENCTPLINAGADMLAIISDIFSYKQDKEIKHKCHEYLKLFNV